MNAIPVRSLWLALLITFIWGVNFVVIRLTVADASPFLVVALRFLLAAVPAVLFIPRPAVRWQILLGYGLAGGVFQFGLLYLAISIGVSAGLASLLIQAQAFLTATLAAVLLKERLSAQQLSGMTLAFLGIATIGLLANHHASAIGLLLILGAALSWAASNILVRLANDTNMISLVVWSSLVTPLPLTLLAGLSIGWAAVGQTLLHSSPAFWAGIAFMAYFNTLLGFSGWAKLIQAHGASRIAPFSLLVPVFGMASNALFFHETFSTFTVLGASLIFVGLLIHTFTRHRQGQPKPAPVFSE
ncbi:EamA family transporter (plasmid) [Deinococcus radiomollis]|uniref:EamA family transporter n=1 Tax=Deinococcus radiomollis TaxID=468916 RepID=UPI003892970C